MPNPPEEPVARLKKEREDQDERWGRAMRRLVDVGDERVSVRPEFFERMDALARSCRANTQGLRA